MQARKMEAAGRRDEALTLYRAALAAIRKADEGGKAATRTASPSTGMVITARRGKPDEQTAALSYATPAVAIVGSGETATGVSSDAADDWLRRAREYEAAGRRKDALKAYREAAAALRSVSQPPIYSPVNP